MSTIVTIPWRREADPVLEKVKAFLFPPSIEEYRVDFARENAHTLGVLLISGSILSLIAFVWETMSSSGPLTRIRTIEYLFVFCFSACLYISYRKDLHRHGTVSLYVWSAVILGLSIAFGAIDPEKHPAFIFFFLLLVLPLMIRDAWGNIMILVGIFAILFVILDAMTSKPPTFRLNMYHLVATVAAVGYLSQRILSERLSFMVSSATAETKAEHDVLTGIYNRRGGEQLIRSYLANEMPGAFMIIDVDDFKHVNDTYGHAAGDEVLKQVAATLQRSFRDSDVVMRMGGDEFVVYAVGMADIRNVESKLEMLKSQMHKIILDETGRDFVTISVGCIVNLGSYSGYEAISQEADKLLYSVKIEGKDHFKCSDKECKG